MESEVSIDNLGRVAHSEKNGSEEVQLSVIIAVRDPERAARIDQLYFDYKSQIDKTGLRFEFIFVFEGGDSAMVDDLRRLKEDGEPVKVLIFAKWYGDATVLSAGFEHASGDVLITLPAYRQIKMNAIPSLIAALDGCDMVIARRSPREDGTLTQLQVRGFHFILRNVLGFNFNDLGCSVRVFRKKVVETVDIYGDQHRFLPVLASHYGFKVREVDVPQNEDDTLQRTFSVGVHVNRLLDLLSILFLTKFTKKPLRFFGFTGFMSFIPGFVITLVMTIQRLFLGISMADRPLLLLGILLIVIGVLSFAIGLIGEMIIFTHSKDLKEYVVEETIN